LPETDVLSLFLIFLLIFFVLAVFLTAWTLWFQAYIYSEPAEQLYWRGPAAAGVLTLFLAVWVLIDYRSPGNYRTLAEFSAPDPKVYEELWVPNAEGVKVHYRRLKSVGGGSDYFREGERGKGNRLSGRPTEIIVKENDEEVSFKPVKTGDTVVYRDDKGKEMKEGSLGEVSVTRTGRLLGNLLLNAFHLGTWFLCLWLLLRYQWPHALGLAVVLWGVLTLFGVPPLLDRAENLARERAASSKAAFLFPLPRSLNSPGTSMPGCVRGFW
jgi:hypothetical protein